ncbi:(2Fe-2S)-binding protein [Streptomyces albipurpureus]|uniref:(2Fe-2S)-binding protein n=1 Tax=Streptomyces albipurpureus TaxID=2897419 RepID=A0ABT0UQP1_9ACTN|nr:(2Fe-2S)-binding protein [Streptomyces sp. CWNU-1]MCM2389561.1 (2Fe-2S)-binding protein [Streptomyces sp. CWNU-1]
MDLRELSSIGGFFALRSSTPTEAPTAPAATGAPLARIYSGDDSLLTLRVDTVMAKLAVPERRVAASIAQLGLAARLWSIALGAAALYGALPSLDPERLVWAPGRGAPDDLWLLEPSRPVAPRAMPGTAARIRDTVQYAHLVPLAEALRRDTPVSRRLLWGNAGSALAGAVRQIDGWARRGGRVDVAERAALLAGELLRHPDLAGTVRGSSMRRGSCCLYYRAPGGGLCGDCVFDHPPVRPTP